MVSLKQLSFKYQEWFRTTSNSEVDTRLSVLPVLEVVDWVGWKRLPLENAIARKFIFTPFFKI